VRWKALRATRGIPGARETKGPEKTAERTHVRARARAIPMFSPNAIFIRDIHPGAGNGVISSCAQGSISHP